MIPRTGIRLARHRGGRRGSPPSTEAAIELGAVTVRYGDRVAVESVTLAVVPGEWIGLLGANGAGKTSLLRAVSGLERSEGEVWVSGLPLSEMSHRQRACAIAYVPQSPVLPPGMTVADYALLGRTPHISYLAMESQTDRERCARVIDRLGLSALASRHLSTLSGGERQRAVLARALAQEAPVLLMDEPTSALDLSHRVEVLELVDDLRKQWGLTVMSALHDLTLAGQFADRLLLMSNGAVVAQGKPAEVLREPVLEGAFGCPIRTIHTDDGELVIVPRRTGSSGDRGWQADSGPGVAKEEA